MFTGIKAKHLPIPDTPWGVGATEQNVLDMEKLEKHGEAATPKEGVARWEISTRTPNITLGKWLLGSSVLSPWHSWNRGPAIDRPHPTTRICTTTHPSVS